MTLEEYSDEELVRQLFDEFAKTDMMVQCRFEELKEIEQ